MKTWNRERKRTRDRLLDDNLDSWIPTLTISHIPYPVVNIPVSLAANALYALAVANGFEGTQQELLSNFDNITNHIIIGTLDTFPKLGDNEHLYYDTSLKILYYFSDENNEYHPIETLPISTIDYYIISPD
jgi:hypothetical protein